MANSSWKGYISFGLISIPVRLFAAARAAHVAFHEIHKKCGTRVRQQLYCPYDKEVVTRDEIAMGYEIEKGKYILVEPAELKALQPKSSTAVEILQFVKLSEVDPIYFETSYFSVPESGGERAYALLLRAMSNLRYAAIAKVTIHQRERTVMIRPFEDGLILHTIYYPQEIHEVSGYGKNAKTILKKQEIDLAEQFAKGLVKPFHPEHFHDEYAARVKQLIESKGTGKPAPKLEKERRVAPVIDLMTALKRSLSGNNRGEGSARRKTLKKTA